MVAWKGADGRDESGKRKVESAEERSRVGREPARPEMACRYRLAISRVQHSSQHTHHKADDKINTRSGDYKERDTTIFYTEIGKTRIHRGSEA